VEGPYGEVAGDFTGVVAAHAVGDGEEPGGHRAQVRFKVEGGAEDAILV
jgi:hypothetical protein